MLRVVAALAALVSVAGAQGQDFSSSTTDTSASSSSGTTGGSQPVGSSNSYIYIIIGMVSFIIVFTAARVYCMVRGCRSRNSYDDDDENCCGCSMPRGRKNRRARMNPLYNGGREFGESPLALSYEEPEDSGYSSRHLIDPNMYVAICEQNSDKEFVALPMGNYQGFYHIKGGRRGGRTDLHFKVASSGNHLNFSGTDNHNASYEANGRYGPQSWNVVFAFSVTEPGYRKYMVAFRGSYDPEDKSISGICLRQQDSKDKPTEGKFSFKYALEPEVPHHEALPSYEAAAAHDEVAHPFQDASRPAPPPPQPLMPPAMHADGKCPNCGTAFAAGATACGVCFWAPQ